MSRLQVDIALSKYYALNHTQYYNDNNTGKFSEWCEDNGYDTDMIDNELDPDIDIKLQPQQCILIQFDPNFPIYKTCVDDKAKEIFNILRKCWFDRYVFTLETIIHQKKDPNIFILQFVTKQQRLLFDGYLRQKMFINTKNGLFVPKDIINLLYSLFELNIKSRYQCLMRHSQYECSEKKLNGNALNDLAVLFVLDDEYFIGYTILSMLLSECNENAKKDKKDKAWIYKSRAYILQNWNLPNRAKMDYKSAIECDPQNICIELEFGGSGICENNMEQFKSSLDGGYHRLAANCLFMPSDFDKRQLITDYGYMLYSILCKYEKAKTYLEIGLDFKSDSYKMWTYHCLGLVNKTMGNEAEANILINKAIDLIQSIDFLSDIDEHRLEHWMKIELKAHPENVSFHQRLTTVLLKKFAIFN